MKESTAQRDNSQRDHRYARLRAGPCREPDNFDDDGSDKAEETQRQENDDENGDNAESEDDDANHLYHPFKKEP